VCTCVCVCGKQIKRKKVEGEHTMEVVLQARKCSTQLEYSLVDDTIVINYKKPISLNWLHDLLGCALLVQ